MPLTNTAETHLQEGPPLATPEGREETAIRKAAPAKAPPVKPMAKGGLTEHALDTFLANSGAFRREMQRFSGRALPSLPYTPGRPLPEALPDQADEMGETLSSFQAAAQDGIAWLFCGPGAMLLGFFFLIPPMIAIVDPPRNARQPNEQVSTVVICTLCGVPLVGLSIWYMLKKRREPRRCVWICSDGIIWERGRRVGCCRWDQIESFIARSTSGALVVWLTPVEGTNFIFRSSDGPSLQTIADYIERRASGAVLPAMLKRVFNGEMLRFEELKLNFEGIYAAGDFCPWSEITDIHLNGTDFEVDSIHGTGHLRLRASDVAFPMVVQAIHRVLTDA